MNKRKMLDSAMETLDPAVKRLSLDESRAENPSVQDVAAEKLVDSVKTSPESFESQTIVDATGDTATSMLLVPPRKPESTDDYCSLGEIDENPLALGTLFGRYRIQSVLGTGGMGMVYLAQDTRLGRQIALKIPRFDSDGKLQLIERFRREARVMTLVQHRNLCPIIDVDELAGRHYLTMSYIDGVPLSQVLARESREAQDSGSLNAIVTSISPSQIAQWIRKLALALDAAHRAGVVHRDLKPANVIIDRQSEPILMDFGLAWMAHETDSRLTLAGAFIGTPAYMSPEQAVCEPDKVGAASDIYSLGVIMYELLAGSPIRSGSVTRVLYLLTHETPIRPSKIREGVDLALEEICWKAIARRPEDRFATAAEFAEALHRYQVAVAHGVSPLPLETSKLSIEISVPKVPQRSKVRIVLACSLLISAFGIAGAMVARQTKSPIEEIVQSPLTGTGKHLPFGPTDSKIRPVAASYVHGATSFTGKWSTDVQAAWRGTFTGFGRIPAGNTGDHSTEYDFSGLAGHMLPAGTYLLIGDLDTIELLTLKAYDSNRQPITLPWLNSIPLEQHGSGTGVGLPGSILPTDLPGWDWNESTQTYSFDVTTIVGNPTLSFTLSTREPIVFLELTREVTGFNVHLMAPADLR